MTEDEYDRRKMKGRLKAGNYSVYKVSRPCSQCSGTMYPYNFGTRALTYKCLKCKYESTFNYEIRVHR